MVVAKAGKGMYLRNRSRAPAGMVRAGLAKALPGSRTNSRGKAGSLVVRMFMTEEAMVRNWAAAFVRLNSSAKKRGLGLFIESQQGMRKATGWLPGMRFRRSTHPW